MKEKIKRFNIILKNNLISNYPKVDEVVEAYLDVRDAGEKNQWRNL